jgi:dTDP-4-amino-4,6-dideoxygalactose transaminase
MACNKNVRAPPHSEILVRLYNCGVKIDPLIKRGIKVRLYRIGSDLTIDFDDFKNNIDKNVIAILVIYYFGFPQAIYKVRAICDERDLFLIGDYGYALFSRYKKQAAGFFWW